MHAGCLVLRQVVANVSLDREGSIKMAQTARYANRRGVNSSGRVPRTRVYVDGNTARKIQEPLRSSRQQVQRRNHKVSRAAQKNRRKAMSMTQGFVLFLTVVLIAILFSCVYYLHTKSQITAQMKSVASLESELAQLKEENDAYYSQVVTSTDLNTIKKTAIGKLGMKYPSEDQVITYNTQRSSYVRQYQDVPEAE